MNQVAVKNAYFNTAATHTIPSATPQGVRLRGLVIDPGVGGVYTDPRYVDFKDDTTLLFRLFVQLGAGTDAAYTNFSYMVRIPGRGIRFPNGISFTLNTNYARTVSVFYEG